MTQTAPTPTPWVISPYFSARIEHGTRAIATTMMADSTDEEADANAAYIVKAVNCHVILVGALKEIVAVYQRAVDDVDPHYLVNIASCALDDAGAK